MVKDSAIAWRRGAKSDCSAVGAKGESSAISCRQRRRLFRPEPGSGWSQPDNLKHAGKQEAKPTSRAGHWHASDFN
eukprot:3664686-Rhodomonas_salina.1